MKNPPTSGLVLYATFSLLSFSQNALLLFAGGPTLGLLRAFVRTKNRISHLPRALGFPARKEAGCRNQGEIAFLKKIEKKNWIQ